MSATSAGGGLATGKAECDRHRCVLVAVDQLAFGVSPRAHAVWLLAERHRSADANRRRWRRNLFDTWMPFCGAGNPPSRESRQTEADGRFTKGVT
jgi:hypothetical protein